MDYDNSKKYKQYDTWLKRKSTQEYEAEIAKLNQEISRLKNSNNQTKWGQPVWEQICHELVWGLGLLEQEPTSPKAWRKVFNVLKVYENAVRTGGA